MTIIMILIPIPIMIAVTVIIIASIVKIINNMFSLFFVSTDY